MKNVNTEHHVLNINTLQLIVTDCTETILHSTASAIQIIKNTSTNRDFTTYRLINTEYIRHVNVGSEKTVATNKGKRRGNI